MHIFGLGVYRRVIGISQKIRVIEGHEIEEI
jgi:hypothetical protein